MEIRNSKARRLPQQRPSPVRIERTKMMRSAYSSNLFKSDIQQLIAEMNPDEEKRKLAEMLFQDTRKTFDLSRDRDDIERILEQLDSF